MCNKKNCRIAIWCTFLFVLSAPVFSQTANPIALPKLPYDQAALAPVIFANTFSFHYGKHYKAYVDNLNKLIAGTDLAALSLEEIIKNGGCSGKAKCLQQRGAGLEPHVLLEKSEAERRGKAFG